MKSHIIAISHPPPSANPATAAMTGLRTRVTFSQPADEVAEEGLGERLVLHLLDVGAGGERLLGAGQHDRANRRIGLERLERCVEVLDQRRRQRIQHLRPVEPDEADAAVGLDDDVGVGHGASDSLGRLGATPRAGCNWIDPVPARRRLRPSSGRERLINHYSASVVTSAFKDKSRVREHQMVYEALKGRIGGALHALALDVGKPV